MMFLTSIYLVGYALSLYWAYLILYKSWKDKDAVKQYLK
jgi:hypothetical protein